MSLLSNSCTLSQNTLLEAQIWLNEFSVRQVISSISGADLVTTELSISLTNPI